MPVRKDLRGSGVPRSPESEHRKARVLALAALTPQAPGPRSRTRGTLNTCFHKTRQSTLAKPNYQQVPVTPALWHGLQQWGG